MDSTVELKRGDVTIRMRVTRVLHSDVYRGVAGPFLIRRARCEACVISLVAEDPEASLPSTGASHFTALQLRLFKIGCPHALPSDTYEA